MNKELEALERITEHLDLDDKYFYKQEKEDEEIIKQALLELQAIKKAKPSKALQCLTGLEKEITQRDGYITDFLKIKFTIIKATLLKAQEDEKIILGIEDYLNRRIDTEPIEDVKKAFIEIRNQLHIIKDVVK